MSETDPIRPLFEQAAAHEPFGAPGDFGFETRLRAALRDADLVGSEITTADWIARFSFRFSAAVLPVVLAVVAVIAFQNYGTPPEGIGGILAHWLSYLPSGT